MANYRVTFHPAFQIVECATTGFLTVDELTEATVATVVLAIEKNTQLILIDDSKLEKAVGTFDIYNLPELYDTLAIDRSIKVSIVLPESPEAKEDVQFYETVCRNKGWNTEIFEQRQEAIDWLRSGPTSKIQGADGS